MTKLLALAALAATVATLSGCGSLTGFSNARTDFACADLSGKPSCRSITDIYNENNPSSSPLPGGPAPSAPAAGGDALQEFFEPNREQAGQMTSAEALLQAENTAASKEDFKRGDEFAVISPAIPWRQPETIFRVWLAPFTDAQGDLHDQRYLYVKVLDAEWSSPSVDELAKSRSPFRPVYPLSSGKEEVPAPKNGNPLNFFNKK